MGKFLWYSFLIGVIVICIMNDAYIVIIWGAVFFAGLWLFGTFMDWVGNTGDYEKYFVLEKNGKVKRDKDGGRVIILKRDIPKNWVEGKDYHAIIYVDDGPSYESYSEPRTRPQHQSYESPQPKPVYKTTVYEIQVSRGRTGSWVKHAGSFSTLRDAQIAWDRRKPSFGQGTKWRLVEKQNGQVVGTQFFMEGD